MVWPTWLECIGAESVVGGSDECASLVADSGRGHRHCRGVRHAVRGRLIGASVPAVVSWAYYRRDRSRRCLGFSYLSASAPGGRRLRRRAGLPSMLASAGGNGAGVGRFSLAGSRPRFSAILFGGPLAKTLLLDEASQKRRRESALTFA